MGAPSASSCSRQSFSEKSEKPSDVHYIDGAVEAEQTQVFANLFAIRVTRGYVVLNYVVFMYYSILLLELEYNFFYSIIILKI